MEKFLRWLGALLIGFVTMVGVFYAGHVWLGLDEVPMAWASGWLGGALYNELK